MRQDVEMGIFNTIESESAGNAGWADVMQKILKTNKPKRKQTVVLSKAKKLNDLKAIEKKENITIEIDGVENKVTTDLGKVHNKVEPTTQVTPRTREKSLGIRVKPSIIDRERERMLQKIATK